MLGKKAITPKMFYNVSLEELVPAEDYYRIVDSLLDLRFIYQLCENKYGKTGKPSIDPVVFFKMQLFGYFENVSSDRQLVKRLNDSLSARLFVGYDLDEKIPWHSTISRTRQHLGEEIFEKVFDYILELCVSAGLVEGRRQTIDSTLVKANASLESVEKKTPVYDIKEYIEKLKEANEEDPNIVEKSNSEEENKQVTKRKKENKEINNNRKNNPKVNQDYESKSDPDSRMAKKPGIPRDLYYQTHFTSDVKESVITDVLTTHADIKDSKDLVECVNRSNQRLGNLSLRINEVVADKGYFSGKNLRELESQEIIPYIAKQKHVNTKKGFEKSEFRYDKNRDCYICPANKVLYYRSRLKDQRRNYQCKDCSNCQIKADCTTSKRRIVTRSEYEEEFERLKERKSTYNWKLAMNHRRSISEGLFAEAKNNHGLSRFNCRKLSNVRKVAFLIAGVLNIKKLLKAKKKFGAQPNLKANLTLFCRNILEFYSLLKNYSFLYYFNQNI